MQYFVDEKSIVRKIWGKADTVLFIFAGAAAEFALNKAVDWLYFTGKLPNDPIGRLFSTVVYARQIIFAPYLAAIKAIDKITAIHQGVEQSRGAKIPDWAYRDVLFMLIDYSIRAYEALEKKLTLNEKQEIFDVFYRLGKQMGITGLPQNYTQWINARENHLQNHLMVSNFTINLYQQYQKNLGYFRYQLLKQTQLLLLPKTVNKMLLLGDFCWLRPMLQLYKLTGVFKLNTFLIQLLIPKKYAQQIKDLDKTP
ncbi:MAG: DUF2236 domain-containing protein [Sphingobacteriales bacterium]|nr:MAG: DUF2236 domain-containing protein [Sphingobacteriales bacterium]